MKNIYFLLIISFSFFSCRKEIVEPEKVKKNQEYVYIEIDGEKYLVDCKKFSFNKNTIGNINDQYSEVADKVNYSIEFENTKLKKGQCKGDIDIAFCKTIGVQLPQYLRLTLKLDKDGQRPIYQIYASYDYNGLENDFQDFNFNLINFNENSKVVEFQFEGTALNLQDSLFHRMLIRAKTIFK